jgi:hypothetical protein
VWYVPIKKQASRNSTGIAQVPHSFQKSPTFNKLVPFLLRRWEGGDSMQNGMVAQDKVLACRLTFENGPD